MISLAEYVLSPIIIKTSFNCGVTAQQCSEHNGTRPVQKHHPNETLDQEVLLDNILPV